LGYYLIYCLGMMHVNLSILLPTRRLKPQWHGQFRKQDVRCTDFGSGRLTIKPFPSPSRFAGDAAAMGRHVQELEDHLHQRDGHIRELEDTIVALEDRHRVEIAEIKSIMVANR